MRRSFIFKAAAPVLLTAFTVTSCFSPLSEASQWFYDPFRPAPISPLAPPAVPVPEIKTVPIGKGYVRTAYLDAQYRPATADAGKTAMVVEYNELAKDVLVISEIPDNIIENGAIVRVVNKQNGSVVSVYYQNGQRFPHKMEMTIDNQEITGLFSLYDETAERFSVEFQGNTNQTERFDGLTLNKNVFSLYTFQSELTESQNIRMENLITSLCIWNSIALQIPEGDFKVNARGLLSGLKSFVTGILCVVAVVAFIVTVVVAPPAAVTIAGAGISVAITTIPQAIAAGISIAAGIGAIINELIPYPEDEADTPFPESSGGGLSSLMPRVTVTCGGVEVKNNNMPPYYLQQGESKTFELRFPNIADSSEVLDAATDPLKAFDPTSLQEIPYIVGNIPMYGNSAYFDHEWTIDGNAICLTITRRIRDGSDQDGRVQFILPFRKNVIINNLSAGVSFKESPTAAERTRKDLFIFNFTVLP
jgi:hypothetical protein